MNREVPLELERVLTDQLDHPPSDEAVVDLVPVIHRIRHRVAHDAGPTRPSFGTATENQLIEVVGRRAAQLFDVIARMHPLDVLHRCERRLVALHHCAESGGDELVLDGRKTLRTFGMMPAHVVCQAVGMGNEGDRHGYLT